MKKLSFFLMAMLISVMSFADTYTHTFKSGELKVGTVTLSGISWTGEGTVPFWGFDSNNGRGLQIGSGSNPCKAFSLSTSGFEGTITEVVVNASMASSGTAKLSISVGGTSYLSNKALTTTATNYTATGEASGDLVISYTNTAKAFYIKSISVTYVVEENPDAVKYTVTANVNDPAMGKVTGAGEYEEGKTATLTAVPNPAYKFVSWSNGSTDNPLKFTVTEDVELTATFEALPAMTCAEASAAASGATVVLNPFDVVAVVKGAGYIYIKDESGVALIFDYTMDDQLKAGDHVEGFVGVSSPYNGLPELKPSVAFADLTVTPGTAPEPTLFTEVPTKADLNKYVKFENVTLTADATFTTSGATNATMVVNGTNVTLRNAFKLAATLTKDKAYNIVGFVAIYNSSIQVYFLSAEEYVAPVVNHTVTVTANAEGENVVSGGGEYEEGEEVTVTASEDLEGWVFIGWTEDGEFVANDPEYTFVVKGDVELVAVYAMDLGENKVTDLVIDGDNMLLTGSVADFQMGTMNLELALGEYNEEEGTYLLTEESKLYVGETNFTFVDGMAAVDMNTNSAMAMVVFEHNEAYYYMTVNMSAAAAKIEATIIEIADATVTIEERSMGFGDEVYHVLKMESTWSDGETTYPVSLETTEFDQTKESQEVAASITVGGMGDEDPWLGSAEGDVTITVADGVVTVEGLLENAYALPAPIAFDVTISGTLPVEEPKVIAYELNGGEFPAVVVPTNEELALAFKQDYAEYFAIEGLTDTDMKREVGNFIYVTNSKGGDAVKFITENANWKWLHDYILTVAGNIPEGTNVGFYWRANLDGFFHCKNAVAVGGVASADYTEAGKPEAWGAAYQAAHAVVLPTEPVDAPYTLPTPVKEGYKFVGWYDNAEGTGEAYTVIPADWSGTLYAIWEAEGPATALDNIAIEGKVVKTIINGQLIIIKNGVQYNAQGQVIK